ncbi:MAG: YitT family protein [Paramuribaculum sp.]|nr:YitT family protein [Paramuribaculum sp.]
MLTLSAIYGAFRSIVYALNAIMTQKRNKLMVGVRDYLFIIIGLALYAFGFSAFILPQKVVMGGMAGLGSVVFFATQRLAEKGAFPWAIPVGVTMYVVNFILLVIAFKIVARTFVIRTLFGMTVLSVMIYLFQPMFSNLNILPDDHLLNLVLGSCIMGIGIGTVFIHNGSSGGTDIVAAMVSKVSNVTIGRTMMMCDCVIVGSAYFVLGYSLGEIVYGLLVTVLTGYMCDLVINSDRQAVQFTIFSKKWEAIAKAVNVEANRGCTAFNGMGCYSHQEVKMLLVMCRRIEAVSIYRIIKSIDDDAFITQTNVNGVYGRGFDQIKVKKKKKRQQEKEMAMSGAAMPTPAPIATPQTAEVQITEAEEIKA